MRADPPPSTHRGLAIILGFLLAVLTLAGLAWLTLSVDANLPAEPGQAYPYTVTYHVQVPDGKELTLAGLPFITLSSGEDVIIKAGEGRERLIVGETRTITERRARISALGLPLMETHYRINATYRGAEGERDVFDLSVQTTRQVPSLIIDRIIPPDVIAQPT